REIIKKVRAEGDAGLLELVAKLDGARLEPAQMLVSKKDFRDARLVMSADFKAAVATAHRNVREFARRALRKNWKMKNAQGVEIGERFDPFERVGIYIPA